MLALVALLWLSGCATYSDNVKSAHSAVASNQPEKAVLLLNEQLETQSSAQLPDSLDEDRPLLLLERAMVLQAMGEYKLASRDMMAADDSLEWLDLTNAESMELAKYMYSEAAEDYRAPAYERLLLNTLNMINFMAMDDIQSAKVEARRFTLLEQFFLDEEQQEVLHGVLGVGNYVGAAAFEAANDYEMAARYYSRAWYYGVRGQGFRQRLVDLLTLTGYKPRELQADDKEALSDILEQVSLNQLITFEEYRQRHRNGDTLIVVQTGLAPWLEPKHIPISTAIGYTERAHRHSFDNDQQDRLNLMVANGVIDSVNFPMLTRRGTPSAKPVQVRVGEHLIEPNADVDIASQVETAYAEIMPSMMVAAITRLITRAAAGSVTEAAVNHGGGGSGLGSLAGLAVKAGMNAADKPDTRSWMTLPARMQLIRVQLGADTHTISVEVGKKTDKRDVVIDQHSVNVMNFSRLR
ncbi:MAG: hypothetical protein ACLFVJ_12410 [Persicimonas sp.]